MALLWADGFDHYGDDENNLLDGVYAEVSSGTDISQSNPRTGIRHLRVTTTNERFRRTFGASKDTVGFGYAVYLHVLPTSNEEVYLAQFRDAANFAQCTITVTTTGQLELRRGGHNGTIIATTSSEVLGASAYSHFECRVRIDDVSGSCEVRINGETVININDVDTKATANDGTSQIVAGNNSVGVQFDIDDMFAWDTEPGSVTDFIGNIRVLTNFVNAALSPFDWIATGGDDVSAISGAVPDDDTSYISASDAGDIAEYSLPALPAEVISLAGVYIPTRARLAEAGVGNLQLRMISNGYASNGIDRPLTTAYTYWADLFAVDPSTGNAWTKEAFEAATLQLEKTV